MSEAGHPTETSLRHLNTALKQLTLGYLRGLGREQSEAEQVAGLSSACMQNAKVMAMMTDALGKPSDKAASRTRVTAQIQHTLKELTSQSHVAQHGGGNYILTASGWNQALAGERRR